MTSAIVIETPRLILRTVTLADVDGVACSWKLDEGAISPAEAEQKIERMMAHHALNRPGKIVHLCLAMIFKSTNDFIGWCGLDHTNPKDADPALFYLLKSSYWGLGLATEAAGALLDYAFGQLELASIHGGAAPDNLASKQVMNKIGMDYLGLDDEGGYAFRLTRDEYLNITRKRAGYK
jgi:RimJ/RimL family protein N-acetyltransferase